MGRDQKKEVMGKIYREFSRQKYNKYKHQYPKMRESEIVSKIIREWDILDGVAKEKLKKQYEQNKILTAEDISESETAKKSEEFKKVDRETTPRRMEMSQAEESSYMEEAKAAEKFYKSAEKVEENASSQQSKPKSPSKFKVISKAVTTNYITFFRHYYEKYSLEHPKWTSSQISKIIRLLWKKNKSQRKQGGFKCQKEKLEGPHRQKKPISGRTAFRKLKNLNLTETQSLWKRLPIESRHYWQTQAQGKTKERPKEHRLTLRVHPQTSTSSLSFLSKVMR